METTHALQSKPIQTLFYERTNLLTKHTLIKIYIHVIRTLARVDASAPRILRCGKLLRIVAIDKLSIETTPFVLSKVSCTLFRVDSTTNRFFRFMYVKSQQDFVNR